MLEASVGSNEMQPIMASPSGGSSTAAFNNPSPTYGGAPSSSNRRSQVLPRAGAATVAGTKGMLATSSSQPSPTQPSFSPRDMYSPDEHPIRRSQTQGFSPARSSTRSLQRNGEDDNYERRDGGDPIDGGSNPNFRGFPDAENLPDPDELPEALEKESEELIDVMGLFFVRCFYSNLWNHRDIAIRRITNDLDQLPHDTAKVVRVGSTLVQSGAGDRIAQVALSAFRLLEKLLAYGSRMRKEDMTSMLANSTTQIVNKLGETQGRVREEASNMLLRLASAKNVGVAFVMSHIVKRSKKPLGIKFLHGRLLVIKELVAQFDLLQSSDHSVEGIMSFMEDSNCFGHQAREIRDVAKEIAVALYLLVGSDIEGYLKSLRPKQLEEYQVAFEAAETARAASNRNNGKKSG
ncbi:hypothetical protein PINS_up018174, partial [Pythium insidiosum]